MYKCNVITNVEKVIAISITLSPCDEPLNLIKVSYEDIHKPKTNFSICLSPLHTKYNDMLKLVEFLEVHKILGVQKIATYIESIGPNVSKVINYYREKKIIDTFEWKVPYYVDAHYHIQHAMLNDCLYRYMFKTKYIAFIDIDEIIVPKNVFTWSELFESIQKFKNCTKVGGYIFPAVVFNINHSNTLFNGNKNLIKQQTLQSLTKFLRLSNYFKHSSRSKAIVDPTTVKIMTVHVIDMFVGSFTHLNVPFADAAVHHYRKWDVSPSYNWITDTTMSKYKSLLEQNILSVIKDIMQE